MFSFTKNDLENFISQVIYNTAKKSGIQDADLKSRVELYQEINQEVREKLDAFIDAYREWYNYNYDEKGSGISNLPDQQKAQSLINARDTTRKELISKIKP